MKKATFLIIAMSLIGLFTVQSQNNLVKEHFDPPLSGNEVVFLEMTVETSAAFPNLVFGLAGLENEAHAWGSYAAGFNLNGDSWEIKPRNDDSNTPIGVFVTPGQKFQVWYGLDVPNQSFNFMASSGDEEASVDSYIFRNKDASNISYFYVSTDRADRVELHTLAQVSALGELPADYLLNSGLETIKLSVGELVFDENTTVYNVNLPKGTTSVDVSAIASVGKATVTGDGTIDVSSGSASTAIQVTAPNGTSKSAVYTVNFTVLAESSIATVSEITVDGVGLSGFGSELLEYNYYLVPGNTTVPQIDATATDDAIQSMDITQANTVPGSATIKVVAEDGTELIYTINFAQNLLHGWDGNGIEGAGSSPVDVGWMYSTNVTFNEANAGGGVRFMDHGNGQFTDYHYEGVDYQDRIFWIRWSSKDQYTYPVSGLEACKMYKFSFKYTWHNNAAVPTLIAGIYKGAQAAGSVVRTADFPASETKRELRQGEFYFIAPGEDAYISFASSVDWGDVMVAITDLAIVEVTAEELATKVQAELFVEKNQVIITNYTAAEDKVLNLSSLALKDDVVVTAPEGVTLTYGAASGSSITIPAADFGCAANVAVGLDATTMIEDVITVTTGSGDDLIEKEVAVYNFTYSGYNQIPFSMGLGITEAGRELGGESTDMATFGWRGVSYYIDEEGNEQSKVTAFANANTSSGNRYVNGTNMLYNPNYNHFDDGGIEDTVDWNEDGTGWMAYIRWDNAGGSNTDEFTIYSYPVELEAGKEYVLNGKYAWINNGSEVFLTFGINTQRDNRGDMLAETFFYEYLSLGMYQNIFMEIRADQYDGGDFTFTPQTSGTYYLTIWQNEEWANVNSAILLGLADLSITEYGVNSVPVINKGDVKVFVDNRVIRVEGSDNYRIFSVSGAEMNAKAPLNTGVYVVTIDGTPFKVLVK